MLGHFAGKCRSVPSRPRRRRLLARRAGSANSTRFRPRAKSRVSPDNRQGVYKQRLPCALMLSVKDAADDRGTVGSWSAAMTCLAMERPRDAVTKRCTGSARGCLCLRQAILGICSSAQPPRTTDQIVQHLELGSVDAYSALIAMQFDGLIDCREATPWTWSATPRGEAFLRQRVSAACRSHGHIARRCGQLSGPCDPSA